MLNDILNQNTLSLSRFIHPTIDLSFINADINYYIYSRDEYLNYLLICEILERLTAYKINDLKAKECDGVEFRSHGNVIYVDARLTAKKSRQNIDGFLRQIVKRKPMIGSKHIIFIQNFDEISSHYQMNYKCLIEKFCSQACFVFTSSENQQRSMDIRAFFSVIRIPLLSKNEISRLCTELLKINDSDLSTEYSIFEEMMLYANIANLNSTLVHRRKFIDVYKLEIYDLIDFLKIAKRKNFEKVILHIRQKLNLILNYAMSDNIILQHISKKLLSLKKIDKHESLFKVVEAQTKLVNASKKIFVYELLFIELFEMIREKYK